MTNGQVRLTDDPVLKLIIEERVLRKIAWIYASQHDQDTAATYRWAATNLVDQISGRKPTSVAGAVALLALGRSLDNVAMIAAAAASLDGFGTCQKTEHADAA
jgi:hypothetical protein